MALKFPPLRLTEDDKGVLLQIVKGATTAYRLFSLIRETEGKLAYTNVLKRFHKLRDLGLIEELSERDDKHGAIKYKGSTYGLYQLILDGWIGNTELLLEYKSDILFASLIFPFFEENTIRNATFRLFTAIWSHLESSCRITRYAPYYAKYLERYVEDVDLIGKLLDWHIKSFILKLAILEPEHWDKNTEFEDPYDAHDTFQLLSKDKKYMNILERCHQEVISGYSRLKEFSK